MQSISIPIDDFRIIHQALDHAVLLLNQDDRTTPKDIVAASAIINRALQQYLEDQR
jgi:hypothetical protein